MKKTTIKNALVRLEQLVQPELDLLKSNMIIPLEENNQYQVFDKYFIFKENNVFVVKVRDTVCGEFSIMRHAISWCISDKYNQYNLSNTIKMLDEKLTHLSRDVSVRELLARSFKDQNHREIAYLKVQNKKMHIVSIKEQLDKCVNLAKYWQIRGFNNETARTGRTSNFKTDRKGT